MNIRPKSRISRYPGSFLLVAAAACMATPGAPKAAPAPGDSYVYRLVNGYNKEVRGEVHYKVDKTDSGGVTVSVTPDKSSAGVARTEIYTQEGNWLLHPVESHGTKVDYRFATAYPAYVFPLNAGKTWSVRVKADAQAAKARTVRVDGKVLGTERIRVPAGEFDAVKIQRRVYSGDATSSQTETVITEIDWYVPALGLPVRTERKSKWQEPGQCTRGAGCEFNGDWDVYELVQTSAGKK